jgi:hypothetical protein
MPLSQPKPMRLSPNFSVDDWTGLGFKTEEDWLTAIDLVEDRIRQRFITWIDRLLKREFAGFATLALDCLLLETLYGFLNGGSTRDTKGAYMVILTGPAFQFDATLAEAFYYNIRCGIVHDTETRKGWLVRMTTQKQIVEKDISGVFILNRTIFHQALRGVFEDWLAKLRAGDMAMRDAMRRRMNEIIDKYYAL